MTLIVFAFAVALWPVSLAACVYSLIMLWDDR